MVDIALLGLDNLAAAMEAPRAGEVVEDLPVDRIEPDPDQPRRQRNAAKDKELAESIKANGVRQPIVVRPAGDDGVHMIVFGERRWDCSRMAGRETVPAIVRDMTPEDILVAQLAENIDRDDMTLVDEVAGVQRAVSMLGSVKAAAKAMGKPMTWVSKRQKIVKSADFIVEFMNAGYSADAEGFYQLAKLAEKHESAAHRLVMAWHAEPAKRSSLRVQVAEITDRLATKRADPAPDDQASGEGKGRGEPRATVADDQADPMGVSGGKTRHDDPDGAPPRVGPGEAAETTRRSQKKAEELPDPIAITGFLHASDGVLLVTSQGEMLVQFADGVLEDFCREMASDTD